MKKTFTILTSLLSLAVGSAIAQQGGTRFQPGEWEVSPFATYVDKDNGKWGAGAALTYFLTSNIGLGASTYWTDFKGTFFDNAAGEAYFRIPIFKAVSPYAVGSIGYQFDTTEWFETIGGGVDFRLFDKIAAFSDIQYRFANQTKDGVFIRLGARFAF